jgi:hypothetical protein
MKIGTEDKKKMTILGVVGTLGVAGAFYIYSQLAVPDAPAAATVSAPVAASPSHNSRATVVRTTESAAGTTKPAAARVELDPTLKMGAMLVTESLVYTGSGRNIFSASSVPVEIPKVIAPARPAPIQTVVNQPPPGPPPPPPIDLKFFGTATSGAGTRQAMLLHGEDVFLASAGDVVQRRYRVVSVAANSVVVEDLTNNNRQTLPLLTN